MRGLDNPPAIFTVQISPSIPKTNLLNLLKSLQDAYAKGFLSVPKAAVKVFVPKQYLNALKRKMKFYGKSHRYGPEM